MNLDTKGWIWEDHMGRIPLLDIDASRLYGLDFTMRVLDEMEKV